MIMANKKPAKKKNNFLDHIVKEGNKTLIHGKKLTNETLDKITTKSSKAISELVHNAQLNLVTNKSGDKKKKSELVVSDGFALEVPEKSTVSSSLWNKPDLNDLEIVTNKLAVLSEIKELFDKSKDVNLTAVIPDEIKNKLKSGEWHLTEKDGLISVIVRDSDEKIRKQIKLKEMTPDVANASANIMVQQQMAEIAERLEFIQQSVNRVIQGQYDDRFAKFFSAERQFQNALLIENSEMKKSMITNAMVTIEDARSLIMQTLQTDIADLKGNKLNSKDTESRLTMMRESYSLILKSTLYIAGMFSQLGEHMASINAIEQGVEYIDAQFKMKLGDKRGDVYQLLDSNTKPGEASLFWTEKAKPEMEDTKKNLVLYKETNRWSNSIEMSKSKQIEDK